MLGGRNHDFGLFLDVIIEFFRHFGGPGTDFEDFVDLGVSGTKKEPPGTKNEPQNEVILHPKSDLLGVVFLMFF